MVTLRDYQQNAIEGVRVAFRAGVRRVLLQMPTGAGKTVCFSYIAQKCTERSSNVLIMAHRIELVDQISGTLGDFQVRHGFVAAGYPKWRGEPVIVASIQTAIRRNIPEPALVVIDEAHHATAKNTIGKILARWPKARVLGVTATPVRLSGEGMDQTFDHMILGPSVRDLIERGCLSPVRVFAPPTVDTSSLHKRGGDFVVGEAAALMNTKTITGDALSHYARHARNRNFVVFTASVEHAKAVAKQFTEAGYPTCHVDGGMDKGMRRMIINDYRDGRIIGLTSCDLISEGFDVPRIECGISLRPTASTGLWLQQIGRCLRTFPGKTEAVILDHAGNSLRHGLPTDDREWTLAGAAESAKKAASTVAVRVCPQCFTANRAGAPYCSNQACRYVFPVKPREVEQVEGNLEEVQASTAWKAARKEQGRAQDLKALIELGRMRGYKSPEAWASYVLKGRQARGRLQ